MKNICYPGTKIILILLLLSGAGRNCLFAQKKTGETLPKNDQTVDSIAFHLYTDSLKKEVQNYINVDGHLAGGGWLPLTTKEISFATDGGRFYGNNLVIDKNSDKQKITITATYIRNKNLRCTTTIYLKTANEEEKLKTKEEALGNGKKKGNPKATF